MSEAVPKVIDHKALLKATLETLGSLSSLKISPFRVSTLNNGEVFVGGFGDVQQAKLRTSLFRKDPIVALKLLRPAGNRDQRIRVIASLARELNVWGKLKHPNILTLTGFYFDATNLTKAWIATPWQKHGNLFKYLETRRPGWSTRLKLVLDTIRGLEYLHTLSPPVCHGDIKAENTLIDDKGNAQLCDFGLAKIVEDVPSGLTTNMPGCTVRYAAPEILRDGSSHSLEGDMWAWGCLVLVIMTTLLPYRKHNSEASVTYAIRSGELPCDLVEIKMHIGIRFIIAGCWSQDPKGRLTSVKCRDVFSTWPIFYPTAKLPVVDIPLSCKAEGDGWRAVHNAVSERMYELEFVTTPISWSRLWGTLRSSNLKTVFSPDGQHIAVVDSYGRYTLREVATGQKLRELDFLSHPTNSTIHEDTSVCAISFSHSGSLLTTGHKNGDVRIWTFPTLVVGCELKGHHYQIDAVTFLHSDTIVVSASYAEDSVRTWNVDTGTLLHEIPVKDVSNVIASPHHRFFIATGARGDFTLELDATFCDAEHGRSLDVPNIKFAAFIGDGSTIITGDWNGELKTSDLPRILQKQGIGRALRGPPLVGPQSAIDSVSVSSDGQLAASGSSQKHDLILWDLASRQPVMKIQGDMLFDKSPFALDQLLHKEH